MLFVSSDIPSLGLVCFLPSFNLGIEMLFVSRFEGDDTPYASVAMFQSRNRDAFRFKLNTYFDKKRNYQCFNLGIEMLFVSSPPLRKPYCTCFHR